MPGSLYLITLTLLWLACCHAQALPTSQAAKAGSNSGDDSTRSASLVSWHGKHDRNAPAAHQRHGHVCLLFTSTHLAPAWGCVWGVGLEVVCPCLPCTSGAVAGCVLAGGQDFMLGHKLLARATAVSLWCLAQLRVRMHQRGPCAVE